MTIHGRGSGHSSILHGIKLESFGHNIAGLLEAIFCLMTWLGTTRAIHFLLDQAYADWELGMESHDFQVKVAKMVWMEMFSFTSIRYIFNSSKIKLSGGSNYE
jgi:hypothetical protein